MALCGMFSSLALPAVSATTSPAQEPTVLTYTTLDGLVHLQVTESSLRLPSLHLGSHKGSCVAVQLQARTLFRFCRSGAFAVKTIATGCRENVRGHEPIPGNVRENCLFAGISTG